MASSSSSPLTHLSLTTTTPNTVTTAVTPHPRRLPPPCWSHDETAALIDAYRDKWYSLRRGNLRAIHWQEVADVVADNCPVDPVKTPVQCRHKIEKLRKRYRNDVNRSLARPRPGQGPISSWVHFNRMHAMEKGGIVNETVMNEVEEDEEDDEDEELYQSIRQGGINNGYVAKSGFVKVTGESGRLGGYGGYGGASSKVAGNGFREKSRNLGPGAGAGFGRVVGNGYDGKFGNLEPGASFGRVTGNGYDGKFGNLDPGTGFGGARNGYDGRFGNLDSGTGFGSASRNVGNGYDGKFGNLDPGAGFRGVGRVGGNGYDGKFGNFGSRGVGNGYEDKDSGFGVDLRSGKRKKERDGEGVVEALKALGDGYVRVERMKMEMAREVEAMRIEMEMKRTEMMLECQHWIVKAFASVVSENKKDNERIGSPES